MRLWSKLIVFWLFWGTALYATASTFYQSINLHFNDEMLVEYATDNLPYEAGYATNHQSDSLLNDAYSVTLLTEKVMEINNKGIYATTIPGIGFRLQVNGVDLNALKNIPQAIGQVQGNLSATATLVIYSKLPSGIYTLAPQDIAQVELGDGFNPLGIRLSFTHPIKVTQNTCELRSEKNQQVQLQPIMVNELIEQKEVFGNQFNIQLSCDANVRAHVKFIDWSSISQQHDCLRLTSDSTARGVCLAIKRKDGTTVRFDEQWVFSEKIDSKSLPEDTFSVHYVKNDEEELRAGHIKAIAMVIFTYR